MEGGRQSSTSRSSTPPSEPQGCEIESRASAEDRAECAYRDIKKIERLDRTIGVCFANDAQLTLTDFYQVTMAYAYWKAGKHLENAAFEMYFRKCPFKGEFCVLAGVEEAVRFLNSAKFTADQIQYLREQMPLAEDGFFEWLELVDTSAVTVHATREGSFVFAREPVLRVEGPLGVCQLLETSLLNLINFPSLVATNAARFRLAAGFDKRLVEFGARRAQGPDGAMSASRYSYAGCFDGTSNVRAGRLFGIPIVGTHAHSFVGSFSGLDDLKSTQLRHSGGVCEDFVERVRAARGVVQQLWGTAVREHMNEAELAAFVAYAQAFPNECTCLVDTYDTCASGLPNYLAVALVLQQLGCQPRGVRLDSGDLAYLSKRCRQMLCEFAAEVGVPSFENLPIIASNDINEEVLKSLNDQQHSIDTFGIGTNLVTCQAQPALGLVFKLCEIEGRPCMKVTQDGSKTSFPLRKDVFRLLNAEGMPVCDLMQAVGEPAPQVGERIECRHPLDDKKRCYVIPSSVEPLMLKLWEDGRYVGNRSHLGLEESRTRCGQQIKVFRKDHMRPVNPTPYKVSASATYYAKIRELWHEAVPMFTYQ